MKANGSMLGLSLMVAVLLSGCVGAAGPTAADIEPSRTAVAPAAYGTNEFWYRMGGGADMVTTYDSLSSIAGAADLVIVGTLQGFAKGPTLKLDSQGHVAYTYWLTIKVARTIRREAISPSGNAGIVQVGAIHGFSWDEARYRVDMASAPIGDRVLLFLRNPVADAARRGVPTGDIGGGAEVYDMINGSQAWLRDDLGAARTYVGEGSSAWMTAIAGSSFDEAVQTVVTAARK
jgi:hypothetical protein